MPPKRHWPPSKSVQHPHTSRSPAAQTIWIPDDWSVFSRAGWRPGTVCGGGRTSGDVLVQSVLCCTLDSWPSHINQICRSSHMSEQHDKPRLLPGTHRTHCQHSVCVSAWVCVCVCISHVIPPETFLQRSVETSKTLLVWLLQVFLVWF